MSILFRQIFLTFVIVTSISLTSCKEPKTPQEWANKMATLKTAAENQSEITPYREEQYTALKAYFEELGLLAVSLKDEPERARQFNETLKKLDLGTLCQQILVTKSRWELITSRCMRNRFFLCAEEVVAYQTFVKSIRESMDEDQRARFDAAYSCKASIE